MSKALDQAKEDNLMKLQILNRRQAKKIRPETVYFSRAKFFIFVDDGHYPFETYQQALTMADYLEGKE